MAYVLTDGKSYIAYRNNNPAETIPERRGKAKRVSDPALAFAFKTLPEAERELERLSGAARGFTAKRVPPPRGAGAERTAKDGAAYVLTDGGRYVAYRNNDPAETVPTKRGKIRMTPDPFKAFPFGSAQEAEEELGRLPKATKGFWIERLPERPGPSDAAEGPRSEKPGPAQRLSAVGVREAVYRKTEGRCYLCGDFVDFRFFEVEHKVPRSAGGTDDVSNLFCSCHACNAMKGTLGYGEFVEKARKIARRHPGGAGEGARRGADPEPARIVMLVRESRDPRGGTE